MSERFAEALAWANELHANQHRKGTDTPYIAHLLAVTGLVIEAGGNEDQAIAALLHDATEDQEVPLAEIEERFGPEVAEIVDRCSDRIDGEDDSRYDVDQKIDYWRRRKAMTIEKLRESNPDAPYLLVSCADKLHNARTILRDLRAHGDDLWARFNNSSGDEQVAHYRALADAFSARLGSGHVLATALDEVVRDIESLHSMANR